MRNLKGKVKKESKKEGFQGEAPYLVRDQGSPKVHIVHMNQYRVQLPGEEGKVSSRDTGEEEVHLLIQGRYYLNVHTV